MHSHFHAQPNYSVEVVLCCRWGYDNYKCFKGSSTIHTSVYFQPSRRYIPSINLAQNVPRNMLLSNCDSRDYIWTTGGQLWVSIFVFVVENPRNLPLKGSCHGPGQLSFYK